MELQIAEQVSRLIAHEVPELDDATDPRAAQLLHYCMRILGSRIGTSASWPTTMTQQSEASRRKLVQAGRTADALELSEHIQRLIIGSRHLAHLPAALQLLCALMHQPRRAKLAACTGSTLLSRSADALQHAPRFEIKPQEVASAEPTTTSLLQPFGSNETAAAPQGSSGQSTSGSKAVGTRANRVVEAGRIRLSEYELVRELLFVMQNIDGAHVRWNEAAEGFRVCSNAALPAGLQQMAGRLSELGWLFRQVNAYVHDPREGSSTRTAGLVPQSLCHALQVELAEWFQLISVLEAQRQSELTLLQLLVWSLQPMCRFITLVQLVRGCAHLKGGALTVGLSRFEKHGDPQVSRLVNHLLKQACVPLYEILERWLLHGELQDPFDEFFIEQKPASLDRLWDERYFLREPMLPCFVNQELAQQVLLVGKTINFIRLACNDAGWMVSGAKVSISSEEGQLHASVYLAAEIANKHMLKQLMGCFELKQHCANIKHYMLLGKGDFVQYLVEHLAPKLSRPINELHRHQMLSLLESAVRSCASDGSDTDHLLQHLDVKLRDLPGSTGWDAFSLDYRAGPPISAIFSSTAMAQYREVFCFLWRLKRVEHYLTAIWRKHGTAARLAQAQRADLLMHRCHCLRNEMIHFVCNLQYYLMFEVLECSWHEMMEQMASASDLDSLISAHNSFLEAVIQKALLGSENAEVSKCLKALFETVLQFCKAQDVLYMHVLEQKAASRQQAAAAAANTSKGRWGCSGMAAAARLTAAAALPVKPHFREQLLLYATQYRRQFTTLFQQVTSHASLDLAFLSFRLDFNLYYESLALLEQPTLVGDS